MGDKEKISELHFIEEGKITRVIEKEKDDALQNVNKTARNTQNPAAKSVTSPICGALLKFAQSKHKFGLKDF